LFSVWHRVLFGAWFNDRNLDYLGSACLAVGDRVGIAGEDGQIFSRAPAQRSGAAAFAAPWQQDQNHINRMLKSRSLIILCYLTCYPRHFRSL
jgi:hypothetical protein